MKPSPHSQRIESWKQLYNELMNFKNSETFVKFGFGIGHEHKQWQTRLEELREQGEIKIGDCLIFPELYQLGLAYASSRGEETEKSRVLNKRLGEALSRL